MDDIRLGSLTLQPRRQLLAGDRREPLGKRALDILSVLAEARGGIVTKDELLTTVWPRVIVEENALQVHIVALRKALGPEADRLRTIRGVGYQLVVDPEAAATVAHVEDHSAATLRPEPAGARTVRTALSWTRSHRIALLAAAVLALLGAAWALFGADLGLRARERIPVVVRELTATTSGDTTEAALASGITDELIVRLRRIPELRIATAGPDAGAVGASFRNAHVVDGTIRRSGDRLRVTLRLAEAGGEVLWSQTFDRRLTELLDMQERIAASIADALSVSLDVGTISTAYGGTDNPEAYAAYLQAARPGFDPDTDARTGLLERALALDPDYIKALASLSGTYNVRAHFTRTNQQAQSFLAKADETSARALAANPELWIGHSSRGWYFLMIKDLPSAERSFRRVAELDTGNEPQLRSTLAGYNSFLGRQRKALALLDSGAMIDPISRLDTARIIVLLNLGRYQEAIDLSEQIASDDPVILRNLAGQVFWSYLGLKKEADAIQFSEQHFPGWAAALRASREDTALPSLSPAELRRWATSRYGDGGQVLLANEAVFASYNGHPKLAVELMRIALERPGGGGITNLWLPAMAEARRTAEFEQLVADLGLVAAWRESGDWGDYCRPLSATEISCH